MAAMLSRSPADGVCGSNSSLRDVLLEPMVDKGFLGELASVRTLFGVGILAI